MDSQKLKEIEIVSKALDKTGVPFALVGGGILSLLIDDDSQEVRTTKDVDVIVEIATQAKFAGFEAQLRQHGFKHDIRQGAPICRWIIEDCVVDVMSVNAAAQGLSALWFADAFRYSVWRNVGETKVRVITPPYFLATKLEAFLSRGRGDFLMSHDLEDIITIIDGCSDIVTLVNSSDEKLKIYLSEKFCTLLKQESFTESITGHIPSDPASKLRVPIILDRLRQIAHV